MRTLWTSSRIGTGAWTTASRDASPVCLVGGFSGLRAARGDRFGQLMKSVLSEPVANQRFGISDFVIEHGRPVSPLQQRKWSHKLAERRLGWRSRNATLPERSNCRLRRGEAQKKFLPGRNI